MSRIVLNGSPRTAARQLMELLTRDNILDEDGNVNPNTVRDACQYAQPRSPVATDGSTPKSKSEIPDAKSEPCSEKALCEPDDTSRMQTPRES